MTVNYSTAVFFINDKLRAVKCRYDPDAGHHKDTVYKTLDPSIKVDDFVVIPTGTRVGFTVVKVIEVDVAVDFDSAEQMGWIACKIDVENHKARLKMEEEAINLMKAKEFEKRRKEILETTFGDGAGDLKALPLASGGAAPIAE